MFISPADFTTGDVQVVDAISLNVGDGVNVALHAAIMKITPEVLYYVLGKAQYKEWKAVEAEVIQYGNKLAAPMDYEFPTKDYGKSLEDWYQLMYGIGRLREATINRIYCHYLGRTDVRQGAAGRGRPGGDFTPVGPVNNQVDAFNRYSIILRSNVYDFLRDHPAFEFPSWSSEFEFLEVVPVLKNYFDL